jgi:hypothetical protein
MPHYLKHLQIGEVSAVDEPANLNDGWMLRKSVKAAQPATIRKSDREVANEMLTAMRKNLGDAETARRLKADPEFAAKLKEMLS